MKNLSLRNNNNNSLISDFFADPFDSFFRPIFVDDRAIAMKTDISETEKDYTLEVDLPGYNKSDIKLDYENGYLTVSASHSDTDKEENKKSYIRKERSVSASRSYYIGDVDENTISAKFDGGVLTIVVPKAEPEQPKKKGINID